MSGGQAPRRLRTGSARDRAADVLVRVEQDEAFAAPALAAALHRAPGLSPADRGLATEVVYGVLRTAPALDARLQSFATRPKSVEGMDPYVRAVVRIAAYEILALDRVPPRASVHAAVESIRRDRSSALGGFANALLRKLAAQRPEVLATDVRIELALASIAPEVRQALARGLGESEVEPMLRAALAVVPPHGVRVNPVRTDRAALEARLAAECPGATVEPGRVLDGALRVTGGGNLKDTSAWREGWFALQEEGAQCVAAAAEARPGMSVLDVCAGRGGKTAALATQMAQRGVLHAVDLYPDKVARISDELSRLGLTGSALDFVSVAVDLSRGGGALAKLKPPEGYDVVLVDAPCSGLGTLARRPDLLWRRSRAGARSEDDDDDAEDSAATPARATRADLPVLQRAILDRVAPWVRVGGTLLYAVCTLTREEGADVARAFEASHPGFERVAGSAALPEVLRPPAFVLRPDREGTDGFTAFRWRCRTGA